MRLPPARIAVPMRRPPQGFREAAVRNRHAAGALLASLSVALLITACNPFSSATASSNEPLVKVGVVPGIDNATLYLAKKDGFFARAGINVRIVKFGTVREELQSLTSGSVNVAAGDYGDLFAQQACQCGTSNLQQNAYKIIADGYDAAAGVIQIMTMPNSGVTSAGDLSNRIIGAPDTNLVQTPLQGAPNSLLIASATSVLQSNGVNMSGVSWRTLSQPQEIDELVHGQIGAALLTQPYVYEAEQRGAYELVDACSGATAGIPLSGYFTSTSWSADKAGEVSAFRAGLAKADAEASMPGPVQAVLPAYAKLSKQEAALVTTGVYPLSTVTASIQRTADLMTTVGMIRKQLNVASMIAR
jgi:NitT/TauT family transport system substrate-binding protein